MSKSNYLEQKVLDHVLRNTPYTSPADVYVGLFTDVVEDDGTGTEVAGNGYARKIATFDRTDNACTNNSDVTFAVATPSQWGTIQSFGVFDALTGGNLLYHGPVSPSKLISAGDAARFAAGELSILEN